MDEISVGVEALTEQQVLDVARHNARVRLSDEARKAIGASRDVVEALADDPQPHYGISTGFGALATKHIPPADRAALQRSLIRSHAAGSGPEVEREVVRALMLLRLSTLATGRTGVRLQTAETYAAMLNAGITPVVYEFGSLGCSGDLAPLAHCALAAMGEGTVRVGGEALPAADALAAADITAARAGGSVLELAAAGLPAVLVPYPHATADHQTGNARWMEQEGAAVVVPDAELDGPRLAREVGALLGSPPRLRAMAAAARRLARPDAAQTIARAALELAP